MKDYYRSKSRAKALVSTSAQDFFFDKDKVKKDKKKK